MTAPTYNTQKKHKWLVKRSKIGWHLVMKIPWQTDRQSWLWQLVAVYRLLSKVLIKNDNYALDWCICWINGQVKKSKWNVVEAPDTQNLISIVTLPTSGQGSKNVHSNWDETFFWHKKTTILHDFCFVWNLLLQQFTKHQ